MAKPVTIHTLETLLANTIEVGDCLEWQGYFATGKYTPYVYNNGSMIAVRKLMAILGGRDVSKASYWGATCDNWRCVNPDHIVGRTRTQHFSRMGNLVDHNGTQRIAKLQDVGRARAVCKLTESDAASIRADDRPLPVIAHAHGISKSRVSKIKRGTAWRQVSAAVNPWGGLIR